LAADVFSRGFSFYFDFLFEICYKRVNKKNSFVISIRRQSKKIFNFLLYWNPYSVASVYQ